MEIWQIREVLEPLACRAAASRVDPAALAGIEEVISELRHTVPGLEDYEAHNRSDLELHHLILEAAGNETLRQVVETLNGRVMQARIVNSPARFHRSLEEHLAIIAALKAGDPDAAASAMRVHLQSARESLARLH